MTLAAQSSLETFDVCVVNIFQQQLVTSLRASYSPFQSLFLYQGALEWTDGQCPGCIQAVQMFFVQLYGSILQSWNLIHIFPVF